MKTLSSKLILIVFTIFLISMFSNTYAHAYTYGNEPINKAPNLIHEKNGAINVVLNPLLEWTEVDNAELYQLEISCFNGTEWQVVFEIMYQSNLIEIPTGILNSEIKYCWKVCGVNGAGNGPWSASFYFTTCEINPNVGLTDNSMKNSLKKGIHSEILEIISPENGATVKTLTPMLIWTPVEKAVSYKFEVFYYDEENLITVLEVNTFDTKYKVDEYVLTYNIEYFWRVRANYETYEGPWTELSTFTTAEADPNSGSIDESGLKSDISKKSEKEYKLNKNYPNPFNPSTKINYELPSGSLVKITIYDLLGREVKTLVNSYQNAGSHTVEFNAISLSSGIYIYRMEANNHIITNTMTLIK